MIVVKSGCSGMLETCIESCVFLSEMSPFHVKVRINNNYHWLLIRVSVRTYHLLQRVNLYDFMTKLLLSNQVAASFLVGDSDTS